MGKLYTLEEAQKIGTQIIKGRAMELKKDLLRVKKNDSKIPKTREISYV